MWVEYNAPKHQMTRLFLHSARTHSASHLRMLSFGAATQTQPRRGRTTSGSKL